MALYWVTSQTTAAPTAQFDAIELEEAGTGLIRVHRALIWQTSDLGDASEEVLKAEWRRGAAATTNGSGGQTTVITPLNSFDATATFTAALLNTTVATLSSGVSLFITGWNVRIPLDVLFPPGEYLDGRNGEVLVFRISAPADAITVNAACLVEQL